MALTSDTDQFSQFLRLAFLRSPNYVAGISGWTINQDGSVEFNNGTFRGVIVGGSLFIYNGTPVLGNPPIGSITSRTTDTFGNTVVPGVCAYITVASGTGAGRYAIDLGDQANPYAQFAALSFKNLTHVPNLPPAVIAQTDTTFGNELELVSGQLSPSAHQSTIELHDDTTGVVAIRLNADSVIIAPVVNAAAILEVNGSLRLDDQSALTALTGAAVLNADANGFPQFKGDSSSGDTTTYKLGHFTSFSTTDEPVTLTTFSTVCGGGAVVAPGKYRVHAELTVVQGPNIASNHYRLGFTGTISQVRVKAVQQQDNTSSFVATTTSNNGLLAAHAYGAGTTYVVTIHATIVTTSSGTLSIQAAMDAAGDTFTVLALSDFHLERIG